MFAIFKREFFSFFHSQMAYIIVGVFLLACGLLFWLFPETSILEYGYAEMSGFFSLAPYLFMFLVSAITMRSFAEERKEGTFILLATKPLNELQIVLGKYFAAVLILVLAILPTSVYYFSIYYLGFPQGNIDTGAVLGSYLGLLCLGAGFTAIGVFASSLTKNQMVAFAISVLLCFFTYAGLLSLSKVSFLVSVEEMLRYMSVAEHYESMSRGVLDTRDLGYFFVFSFFFVFLTKLTVEGRKW